MTRVWLVLVVSGYLGIWLWLCRLGLAGVQPIGGSRDLRSTAPRAVGQPLAPGP